MVGREPEGVAKSGRTIGEVIAELVPDFPDLTISKIRFLEGEGLIAPERSPAGYRRFTPEDVERLRWVLTAQRDQYLPLRVIRQRLASGPAAEAGTGDDGVPGTAFFQPGAGELSLTREQLVRAAGIDEDELAEMEAYGLLSASSSGRYGADALLVAKAAAELGRLGLQPRHLRPIVTGAQRTADLLGQLVDPLRRPAGSHGDPAAPVAAELAGGAVRLHAALLRAALAGS